MPSVSGRVRRQIELIKFIRVLFGSFEYIDDIMLERDHEVRKNSVVAAGFFGKIYRDPDVIGLVRIANEPSGSAAQFHDSACIRTNDVFTAYDQKSDG